MAALSQHPLSSLAARPPYIGAERRERGGKSAFVGCVCYLGFSLCFTELSLRSSPIGPGSPRSHRGRSCVTGGPGRVPLVGGEGYAHLRAPTGPSAHPTKEGASGPRGSLFLPAPRPSPSVCI